jgi:hypothetical protein
VSADLPPVGTRVRVPGGVGVVTDHLTGTAFGRPLTPLAFVEHADGRWHPYRQKHGGWYAADEITNEGESNE